MTSISKTAPGPAEPLTFPRDHHQRRRYFAEESFEHKARANLYWLAWLLDEHTSQSETVLDPMGGSGSILYATLKRRPVITGDVEPHWVSLQAQNAARIRAQTMFAAPAYVARWDAAKLPFAAGSISAIVTSPPYYDLFSDWNRKSGHELDGQHVGETGSCYGFDDRQLGNIHVYERYLRAMRAVYLECWRVLRPGGVLVLIVGDRVKRHRVVPITADTEALCRANGFDLLAHHQRASIPSRFRNIHAKNNGDDYPSIETESALVFQKPYAPPRRPYCHFALVQAPRPNSSPGLQLFNKVVAYGCATADRTLVMTRTGFAPAQAGTEFREWPQGPSVVWSGDHAKARARKDWAFAMCRQLVERWGVRAGDVIELHISLNYARYIRRRLGTYGCLVSIPTARHNLGQKLRWYTKRCSSVAKADLTALQEDCQ